MYVYVCCLDNLTLFNNYIIFNKIKKQKDSPQPINLQ